MSSFFVYNNIVILLKISIIMLNSEMSSNFIKQLITSDLFTMSTITRYSWAYIIKWENLAEHSYYVTVLADLIAEDIHKRFPDRQIDRHKVLLYWLYHDYEEVYTWDIVTPVKYKSTDFRDKLEDLGDLLMKEWTQQNFKDNSHIGDRIYNANKLYESKKDKVLENRVVKFADTLQSLIYVIRETNMWNIYMEDKLTRIIDGLIKKYSTSRYFRPYISNLKQIIESWEILKTNIVSINWEEFLNTTIVDDE